MKKLTAEDDLMIYSTWFAREGTRWSRELAFHALCDHYHTNGMLWYSGTTLLDSCFVSLEN